MEVDREILSAVITGPTGALGSALCAELANSNIEVYAVCRPGSSRIKNIKTDKRVHLIELDISELNRLPSILHAEDAHINQVDAFFHFAWTNTIGSGRNDMDAQIANIGKTIEAVRIANDLGCKVFLGAGSQAEYGRHDTPLKPETPCFPDNGYGMAKLCAGEMSRVECQKYGIDHIWMRILSIYGPGDSEKTLVSTVIQKLRRKEHVSLTAGEQIWDYLYSGDAARAFRLAAEHGRSGAIYPLGSGNGMPLKKYINTIGEIFHANGIFGFGEIPYSDKQVKYLVADTKSLSNDTGWTPKVRFKNGIEKILEDLTKSDNAY